MKKYLSEVAIKFIKNSNEKTYQYIEKNKTKCPCFICRAKMRYIDYRIKFNNFCSRLLTAKWINVEYWGSDYPDFREYEVIGRQKIRTDGKGMKWPKTNYNHIKQVEVGA